MRSKRQFPDWVIQSAPPLVTMLVSGLWHGAGWTFLVWGGMYGLLIVTYQLLGLRGEWKPQGRARVFFAWLVMFTFIAFGWLLFRSHSLTWAFQSLFSNPFVSTLEEQSVGLIALSMTMFYSAPLVIKLLMDRHLRPDSYFHAFYYAAATLAVIIFLNMSSGDFIYFQF